MALYIPGEESFGGRLGTALGTGIGTGLQQLADQKLKEVTRRQQSAFWNQVKGISPELAEAISDQPPEFQKALLDRFQGFGFKEQQPSGLQAIQQAAQPQEQQGMQELQNQQQLPQGIEQVAQAAGRNLTIGPNQAERRFNQQQELGERKLALATRKEAREYLAPFEEKHVKSQKAIRRNKQIIDIARSGKLRAGYKQQLLDKLGLGNFWRPIENELAEKNLAAQATNAGAAFNTSRLTNLDVNLFKASLGTLWNTPQGLEAIARINNLEYKADEIRHKSRRDIIKENNGEIPFDIESQIEDRVGKQLKQYADKSMKIINNALTKTPGKNVAKRAGKFNTLESIPTQGLVYGQKARNDETGQIVKWNGQGWS